MKRALSTAFCVLAVAGSLGTNSAAADDPAPIKIGEVNSYSGPLAAFTAGYRKGLDLAVEQINSKGGVLGRRIEIIYRDDNFSPADAARMANELVLNQKVDLLAGTYLSPAGLAVATYAQENKVLFVATEPLANSLTWGKGSRYVFRVQTPISVTAAALAFKAADLKCTKWAGTGPISEAVTDLFKDFRANMSKKAANFEWVGDMVSPIGKMNAGATIERLQSLGADCVLNAQAGPDLVGLIREGKARGYLDKVQVVSLQTGIPEWLNSLKAEAPVGWIVSGYPWQTIDWPAHKKFVADYQAKYNEDPTFGSFIGYLSGEAIAAGIARAGSLDVDALIKGFRGAEFDCVIQKCKWRQDHQLNLGSWIGKISLTGDKATVTDSEYIGEKAFPTVEEGLALRPAGAND